MMVPGCLLVRQPVARYGPLVGVLCWLFSALAASPLLAQTQGAYCVRCTAPVANYLCSLPPEAGQVSDTALKLFCIERASKELGHGFCSIQKNAAACPDVRQSFVFSQPPVAEGGGAAPPAGQSASSTDHAAPHTAPAVDAGSGTEPGSVSAQHQQQAAEQPPETLVELTSQAARQAKTGMAKASKAVSQAVKKTGQSLKGAAEKTGGLIKKAGKSTWKCLGSLFTDC